MGADLFVNVSIMTSCVALHECVLVMFWILIKFQKVPLKKNAVFRLIMLII